MATARSILAVVLVGLAVVPAVLSQAPGPPALDVGTILANSGTQGKFAQLMKATQQDAKLNNQASGSGPGFTVFAPTDEAFNSLKPGTIEGLSKQKQETLVQAHIVPDYLSKDTMKTANNPFPTQGISPNGAPYTVNFTASETGQVNITNGLVTATVGATLRSLRPLSMYSINKVLLPPGLLDYDQPKGGASTSANAAAGGKGEARSTGAAAVGARAAGWSLAALVPAAACLL